MREEVAAATGSRTSVGERRAKKRRKKRSRDKQRGVKKTPTVIEHLSLG